MINAHLPFIIFAMECFSKDSVEVNCMSRYCIDNFTVLNHHFSLLDALYPFQNTTILDLFKLTILTPFFYNISQIYLTLSVKLASNESNAMSSVYLTSFIIVPSLLILLFELSSILLRKRVKRRESAQ